MVYLFEDTLLYVGGTSFRGIWQYRGDEERVIKKILFRHSIKFTSIKFEENSSLLNVTKSSCLSSDIYHLILL